MGNAYRTNWFTSVRKAMKGYRILVLVVVAFVVLVFSTNHSSASINKAFNYQGKLLDADSTAVANGAYNMYFLIYDSLAVGNCLWASRGTCGTPTAKSITVSGGLFSTMLGESGDNAMSLDYSTDSYYLEVRIDYGGSPETLSPRKRMGAVPQAFNANNLIGDGSMALTSAATSTNIAAITGNSLTTGSGLYVASSTLSSGSLINVAVTGTAAASNTQKALNISTSGANATTTQTTYGGYITNTHTGTSSTNVGLYVASSDGSNNYAAIFNGGNVGINTITPTEDLDVDGDAWIQHTLYAKATKDVVATVSSADDTIYVDATAGSDVTGDGLVGNPYATITRALQDVPDVLLHDYVIQLVAGTYREQVSINKTGSTIESDGTAATLTIKGSAAAPNSYRITGSDAVADTTPVRNFGIIAEGPFQVVVEGVLINYTKVAGIIGIKAWVSIKNVNFNITNSTNAGGAIYGDKQALIDFRSGGTINITGNGDTSTDTGIYFTAGAGGWLIADSTVTINIAEVKYGLYSMSSIAGHFQNANLNISNTTKQTSTVGVSLNQSDAIHGLDLSVTNFDYGVSVGNGSYLDLDTNTFNNVNTAVTAGTSSSMDIDATTFTTVTTKYNVVTGAVVDATGEATTAKVLRNLSGASTVADGASTVAFDLDTLNTLSTSGALLMSLKNAGSEKFYVNKAGGGYFASTVGIGVAPHATDTLTITSTDTTASSKAVNVTHSGAITGTGYGIYVAKSGASTTNVGIYVSSLAATTNYGIQVAAMTGATSYGVDIGNLSGATANYGINIGTISSTGTATAVTTGIISGTGATAYQLNLGAISGANATSHTGIALGNISGTTPLSYGINLGTLTGGTTSNYQINTGTLTKVASAINAQLNLGAVSGDAATSTNYGINIGAVSGTGTVNYGLYVGAVSGATANYAAIFAGGNVGIGATAPNDKLEVNGNIRVTQSATPAQYFNLSMLATYGSINAWNSAGGGAQPIALNKDGGNVGIGLTTNINSKLTFAADTTAAGGILFGTDTNLYRSAADTLKTDDSLAVATNLTVTGTGQFARAGIGVAPHATDILSVTSTDTTASSKALNISHSGAITGTGYGIYVAKSGASTTNVGIYVSSLAATTNYGLQVAAMTGATSYGVDIGNLSGATANYGINIGTISSTGTASALTTGAISGTGATAYQLNLGAISGANATSHTGIALGNISGTTPLAYGINLGTLTGGTTSNYQINTGVLTKVASATNAQLNLGAVSGDAASSTNYGINIGAVSGTGTVNYGLYVGAVSGATANYGAIFADGNVGVGTLTPTYQLETSKTVKAGTAMYANTRALDFDGNNDNVDLGDITELNSVTNFTVSTWFRQDVLDVTDYIFRKYSTTNVEVNSYTNTDGYLYFNLRDGAVSYGRFDYSTVVTAGRWHHIVYTYDGTQVADADKLKIYVDGTQMTLAFNAAIPAATPNLATKNAYIGYNTSAFDGGIQDFRIYSSTLGSSDIATIYQGGTYTTNMVHQYKLMEGTGIVATDTGSNVMNGTISGATWSTTNNVGIQTDFGRGALTLAPNTTGAKDGLWFGYDVNLYRSAADTLKTDDSLVVEGDPTAASSAALTINNAGAVTGTGYGGYFAKSGASTTNVGLYTSALAATTNYGLQVAAMTGATSYGVDIGALSGATANYGVNIGAISGTGTAAGVTTGAISSTGATAYQLNLGAISGANATSHTGIALGNISGTTPLAYGINLGTLTGGTTSNYQINTGALTAVASATNAQLNLGTVSGTAASSTNYGINIGAMTSTGTTNTGLYVGAVSGATNNYAGVFAGGAVTVGTTTATSYGLTVNNAVHAGSNIVLNNNILDFDGNNDYVNLGNMTELNSATNFSVTQWVKQDVIPAIDDIFVKYVSANNFYIATHTTNSRINIYLSNGSTTFGYLNNYQNYMTAGRWHHLAVTYDGTQTDADIPTQNALRLKLYIDGTYIAFTGFSGTIPSSTPDLSAYNAYIGYAATSMDGGIFDARVYSETVSAANMATIYQGGTYTTNMVHQYKLMEGAGTVATDTGSNVLNGAISGATWTSSGYAGLGTNTPTTRLSFAVGTTRDNGISFGNDTWLYRSSAGILNTDGGVVIGANATTGATANQLDIGAISGANATSHAAVTVGNISGTTPLAYGVNLGTMTGGTTSNYQINTGALTKVASATNAQLNLGAVSGTAASSTNYGINVGAVSGTGTANYGLYLGAVSGATANYSIYAAGGVAYFADNVQLATGKAFTGAGTVTLSSATASSLTIDSGTTGALDIGTGANAKTLTIGNNTTSTALVFTTGTGGVAINLADNDTDQLDIQQGTDNYLNINTTNTSEAISFGNATTNPTFYFLGSSNVGIGMSTGTTAKLHILEDTLGGETLRIETEGGTKEDPNYRIIQQRVQTADATETALWSADLSSGSWPLHAVMIEARVVAKVTNSGPGTGATYIRRASFAYRAAEGAVQYGATQDTYTAEGASANYDVQIELSGTTVYVNVTGLAATNVTWQGTIIIQDVSGDT